MKFPVFGASDDDPGAGTVYAWPASFFGADWDATEANRQIPLSEDCTVSDFKVILDTAPGAGKSRTFTLRKNGVDTACTLTISDTATSGTFSGSVSFAADDLISIKETSTGTPTAPGRVYWWFYFNTTGAKQMIMGACLGTPSTSAVNYCCMFGSSAWNATNAVQDVRFPTDGNFTRLKVKASAAPGASKSYDLGVRGNSSDVLVGTLTGAATTMLTVTSTVAVTAGTRLQFKSDPTGTPAAASFAWCITFEPTVYGEAAFGFGSNNNMSTSVSSYEQGIGTGAGSWATSPTARRWRIPASTVTKLYGRISNAAGALASRSLSIAYDSTTVLSANFADPTVNSDSGGAVGSIPADGGTNGVHLAAGVSATPPANANAHIGYVLITPQEQVEAYVY